MKLIAHKRYSKHFQKLSPKNKVHTEQAVRLFKVNPFDLRLHNHKLVGSMQNWRAISVTGDIRIIFQEFFNYEIVVFLDIGTHSQVY